MTISKNKSLFARVLIISLALTFLYLPIATLIIYSFNESRMVTVWTEFSLKWYHALFNNEAIIRAVGMSLLIAFMTAAASVVIGTLAAFVLVRVRSFKGESLFVLLMTAPMILPEVITGLALLLIFVTLGTEISFFAHRGVIAIWIAHVTFCSAYSTVVIRSRFRELDISIEEAAMDLGAGPIKVFFAIILPALMPAEIAAFLLAFTMSMDDLVITSFIAGPDSTTLPMLIFSSVRRGLSPEINALASVIVFVVSIFTFFAWLSMVKKQKRKKADAAKAARETASEQELHYKAPHGQTVDLHGYRVSQEQMSILKDQAAALAEGRDIAFEIEERFNALNDKDEALDSNAIVKTKDASSHQKVQEKFLNPDAVEQGEELYTTTSSLEDSKAKVANKHDELEQLSSAVLDGQNHPETLVESKQNLQNVHAQEKKNASALGESAREATSQQRFDASVRAASGQVHVVDNLVNANDTKASSKLNDSEDLAAVEKANENEKNTTLKRILDNVSGSNKSQKNKAAPVATTSSSLADAKARKAALKSNLAQVIEKSVDDNDNGTLAKETAETATTSSSLADAKAKKIAKVKNIQDETESAKAVTKVNAELAKSSTNKAKVVDETKK